MEDSLNLLRAAGIILSDDEVVRFAALRQHFASARARLEAVHVGEIEPAVTFRASSAPDGSAADEEET